MKKLDILKNTTLQALILKGLFLATTSLNALIMVKYLDSQDLGVWYIFATIQTFIFILSNAFIPNVSRQYTLADARLGVKFDLLFFKSKVDRLFLKISSFIALLLMLVTFVYLEPVLDFFEINRKILLLSWVVLASSCLLEVYFSKYDCILMGYGRFKEVNSANFIGRISLLLMCVCYFSLIGRSYGLLAFCFIYLFSNIVKRYLIVKEVKKILIEKENSGADSSESIKYYFSIHKLIIKLSMKSLVASAGSVMITRSAILIMPLYLSINEVASYGLTYQLYELSFNLIFTCCVIFSPKWVRLFESNDKNLGWSYYKVQIWSFAFMSLSIIFIISVVPFIFNLFHVNTALLSKSLCLLLGVIFLLQMVHSIAGQLLTIKNEIPYAYASFGSGLMIALITFFILPEFGVVGAILAILLVQLTYNNWKWPLQAHRLIGKLQ